MPELIGFSNCPICGEAIEVKINKNRKLYAFCDNGCSFKLNANLSREGIAALAQGKVATCGKVLIRPLKREVESNGTTGTNTRNITDGRNDTNGSSNAGGSGDNGGIFSPFGF